MSSADGGSASAPISRATAWMAAIGLAVASYDTAALSTALPTLRRAWHLSGLELGTVASAALVGMIVGSLLAGVIADRYGRRLVLLGDFLTFGVAALACALAPNWGWLAAWRVLVGVGVGADYAVVFPYLAETQRHRRRGAAMAWALWGTSFGMVLAYSLAAATAAWPLGWRLPLAGGALLVVPLLLVRRRLPESDLWRRLRTPSLGGMLRLLAAPASRAALWSSSLNWFSYQVGDQGLTLFLPLVLVEVFGVGVGEAAWASVLVKAVTIPAALATVWLIESWGRRPLQVWGFLVRAAALLALAGLTLGDRGGAAGWSAALLALAYASGAMGPDKTTVITAAERADTGARATAQAVAEAAGRLGGLVGVGGFSVLAGRWGAGAGLLLFGAMALVGFVASWSRLPETRGLHLGPAEADPAAAP